MKLIGALQFAIDLNRIINQKSSKVGYISSKNEDLSSRAELGKDFCSILEEMKTRQVALEIFGPLIILMIFRL